MIEKFSDYEGTQFLEQEGEFVFEITDYELVDGKAAPVAKFTAKCDAGITTIRMSLSPKARWKYNSLIAACLHLNTPEKRKAYELDYEVIGQQLVGCKFIGYVECEEYEKVVKVMLDDGTFDEKIEVKQGYKCDKFEEYLGFGEGTDVPF